MIIISHISRIEKKEMQGVRENENVEKTKRVFVSFSHKTICNEIGFVTLDSNI